MKADFIARARNVILDFDPSGHDFTQVQTTASSVIHKMDASAKSVSLRVRGKSRGNRIFIGKDISGPLTIDISGSDNTVWIGEGVKLPRCKIQIKGQGGAVLIGARTTCTGGGTVICGQNDTAAIASVIIGDDGMWAKDVSILSCDIHPIFDLQTGQRLNAASDAVLLEPFVWLAQGVSVMKNVTIGAGSCVGIGSVVTRTLPRYTVAAGCPARVVREGAFWSRNEAGAAVSAARSIQSRFPPVQETVRALPVKTDPLARLHAIAAPGKNHPEFDPEQGCHRLDRRSGRYA